MAGKSDPFAVVQVGRKRHRSKAIAKELDPVWNASFELYADGMGCRLIRVNYRA